MQGYSRSSWSVWDKSQVHACLVRLDFRSENYTNGFSFIHVFVENTMWIGIFIILHDLPILVLILHHYRYSNSFLGLISQDDLDILSTSVLLKLVTLFIPGNGTSRELAILQERVLMRLSLWWAPGHQNSGYRNRRAEERGWSSWCKCDHFYSLERLGPWSRMYFSGLEMTCSSSW